MNQIKDLYQQEHVHFFKLQHLHGEYSEQKHGSRISPAYLYLNMTSSEAENWSHN